MAEVSSVVENASKRVPWNKGKVVGAKKASAISSPP
jgi:hypothetical protein